MIRDLRARTQRTFAVNLIVENTALGPATTDDHIAVCAAERVPIVVFFWKSPAGQWLRMLRSAGVRVWATAATVSEASALAALDVDAIVVQGREAGGHVRASEGLLTLVPRVRAAIGERALIAAGGIGDGPSAAAALAAGADAVCVGTRLVASEESEAHAEYKSRLAAAEPGDTAVTELFGPEWPGAPMRVLVNRAVRRAGAPSKDQGRLPEHIGETQVFGNRYAMPLHSAILPTRHTTGDFDEMCLAAGESVGFVTQIEPAAAIVGRIMNDAARPLEATRTGVGPQTD
jgi:NAD(P)H-dependent flavin oxidoreductase YrpB (nitropropane dioxygenase family)